MVFLPILLIIIFVESYQIVWDCLLLFSIIVNVTVKKKLTFILRENNMPDILPRGEIVKDISNIFRIMVIISGSSLPSFYLFDIIFSLSNIKLTMSFATVSKVTTQDYKSNNTTNRSSDDSPTNHFNID